MTSAPWLRVLLYQDLPGLWVARTLEHDIVVEGQTVEEAVDAILRIIDAHIEFDRRHGRHPLSAFPEAPARYWTSFDAATHIRTVTCNPSGRERGAGRAIVIAMAQARPLPAGIRPSDKSLVLPAPSHQPVPVRVTRPH